MGLCRVSPPWLARWRAGALARWRAGALARSHMDRIESPRIGSPRAVAGATAEKKIAKTYVKHSLDTWPLELPTKMCCKLQHILQLDSLAEEVANNMCCKLQHILVANSNGEESS